MSELKMPRKGQSALMLQDLNAEHAASPLGHADVSPAPLNSPLPTPGDQIGIQPANVAAQEETQQRALAATLTATLEETQQPAQVVTQQPGNVVTHVTALPRKVAGNRLGRHKESDGSANQPATDQRLQRFNAAIERCLEDDVTVVSVRVSLRLNAYMDDYVARVNRIDPKRKYRKQDAVAEAFAAFYADHPMPALTAEDNL